MSLKSSVPGPVVWLTACSHGDEVGGIVVIQEIFKRLKRRLIKGNLFAFPLMNPIGFENISRTITHSREDLNRSFPGNPNGTLGERIASHIFSAILETAPSLLLDLHNDWKRSIPYALLDRKSSSISRTVFETSKQVCITTGLTVVEDTDEIRSSLTHNLLLRGIPSITLELGESYVVSERIIDYGLHSIWNVLEDLKMITPSSEKLKPLPNQVIGRDKRKKTLRYSDKPYCTKSGIIRFLVRSGDIVETGQPVAKIYNAFGKRLETITALHRSIILGTSDSSVAFPGISPMVYGII